MLSKLRFFRSREGADSESLRAALDLAPLRDSLGTRIGALTLARHGTLGAGFLASLDGRPSFLKTFAAPDGATTLAKEAAILEALYGASIRLRTFADRSGRLWIAMDALAPTAQPLTFSQAVEVKRSCSAAEMASPVTLADDIGLLLVETQTAVEYLGQRDHISPPTVRSIVAALSRLEADLPSMDRMPCHGDFGPMNIMTASWGPVVVDWEDAFMGVAGYDLLYWLTFFQNRRFMDRSVLGFTPHGRVTEVAFLLLIIAMKCYISVLAGTHRSNSLSFDERIAEAARLA